MSTKSPKNINPCYLLIVIFVTVAFWKFFIWNTIISNQRNVLEVQKELTFSMLIKINCLPFVSTWIHLLVAHCFSFLCCPIMHLYVLSSVLWYPLRFPHGKDVRFIRRYFPEGGQKDKKSQSLSELSFHTLCGKGTITLVEIGKVQWMNKR
jgi:hypothetical protein